jgi:membrane dipeptidase
VKRRIAIILAILGSGLALAAARGDALHQRLLVLDTHLDAPVNFERPGWDIMARHTVAGDFSQLDYPRMKQGGLDGGFFAIFTPQGPLTAQGYAAARDAAIIRETKIREMVAAHPAQFELAFSADDAARIAAKGKRVVFQSIENSYPLGEDLSLLETFYRLGVRMAGPVHFRNNQFADSANDQKKWGGLSPLGVAWVGEMNRLGMVIDASHASDDVFDQLLKLSKTPIILSHSGCRAVFDNPRNIDDARLRALAAAGGVIQINSLYVAPTPPPDPERVKAMAALAAERSDPRKLTPEALAKLSAAQRAIDARFPPHRATFDDFMKHLLHALAVAGPDHVGIGADWDGGGGVAGMEDVADLAKITQRLKAAGYSDADLAKIWGGNVLRVLRAAEAYKAKSAGATAR